MTIHGDFLPFPRGEEGFMDQKPDAAEILRYLKDFVNKTGLQSRIQSSLGKKTSHGFFGMA